MKDLFLHDSLDTSPVVFSDRILYTPTSFAKTALLYLQEIGSLQARKPHTSSRTRLSSYLFFCVDSGSGELEYQGKRHKLGKGDCVFIDCQLPYSHSTDTDLWSLSWIHFSGVTMQTVYQKYQERGGRPVFKPDNFAGFQSLHQSLFDFAASDDYIRDMRIKGVFVNCDHNPQMMLYALGAYHAYGYLYSIKKVSMTIIQPRLENISTFECSVEELLDWAETYVRPRAKLAFEGKGEQVPGDWCRFCRARTSCKACADEAMALVKEEFLDLDAGVLEDETEETDATASFDPDTSVPTFKSPALLSKTDIEKMLPTLNRIESWIEAIFAYVSSEAINHGVSWDGYKVVEGRSKRQFLDTKSVVAAAEKAGYTDIYKTELISLTAFEKLMGKKKFQEILGEYVVKPPGKLALVPDSDPREAVDLQTAEDEFAVLD